MTDDSEGGEEWLTDEQRETLAAWREAASRSVSDAATMLRRLVQSGANSAGDHVGNVRKWLMSTQGQLVVSASAAIFGAAVIISFAFVGYGALAGILAAVGLVVGVAAPWVYVRVMFAPVGDSALATGWFILGQLTYGQGALVERATGGYEWRRLQQDGRGLYCKLSNGDRVDIGGELADLPTVAWAPLAVVSEKRQTNMDRFTVGSDWDETRPDPTDTDSTIHTPKAAATDGGGWHLDASKLEDWARGAGSNELPRNGRRMALEEAGGEQAVSQLFIIVGAAVLAVVGFVLGSGVLILTG